MIQLILALIVIVVWSIVIIVPVFIVIVVRTIVIAFSAVVVIGIVIGTVVIAFTAVVVIGIVIGTVVAMIIATIVSGTVVGPVLGECGGCRKQRGYESECRPSEQFSAIHRILHCEPTPLPWHRAADAFPMGAVSDLSRTAALAPGNRQAGEDDERNTDDRIEMRNFAEKQETPKYGPG